jgi:hypothetical protein
MRLVQAHTSAGSERLGSSHAFRLGIPASYGITSEIRLGTC